MPTSVWFLIANVFVVVAVAYALNRLYFRFRLGAVGEQQTAVEDHRFRQAVMANAVSGILVVDAASFRILEWNDTAARVLGYTPEEIVGKPLASLIPQDRRHGLLQWLSKGLAGWDVDYEPMVAKDGSRRCMALGVRRVDAKLVMFTRDVTKRVEAEERHQQAVTQLLEAEAGERARIAGELHDDVVQVMTAALLRFELLRDHLSEYAEARVTEVEWTIRHAMERTRKLMFDLRPAVLETEGLASAIRTIAEHPDYQHLQVNVQVPDKRYLEHIEALCYRTVSEAMHNALKHAECKRLVVMLHEEGGALVGMVGDDGQGFDVDETFAKTGKTGHIGMAAMVERVKITGGTIKVLSAEGMGTSVNFTIPVNDEGASGGHKGFDIFDVGRLRGDPLGVPSGDDVA